MKEFIGEHNSQNVENEPSEVRRDVSHHVQRHSVDLVFVFGLVMTERAVPV